MPGGTSGGSSRQYESGEVRSGLAGRVLVGSVTIPYFLLSPTYDPTQAVLSSAERGGASSTRRPGGWGRPETRGSGCPSSGGRRGDRDPQRVRPGRERRPGELRERPRGPVDGVARQ